MTAANSPQPSRLATWLLEQFSPALDASLTGDLMEAFQQGRSSGWYRRQVLWAILMALPRVARKRWGSLTYAVICGFLISAAWLFRPGVPAVSALYAESYGIEWPWSLVYQRFFLTVFQAVFVAFALIVYLASSRIFIPQRLLRLATAVVVLLAAGNVATTLLVIAASAVIGAVPLPLVRWMVGWMFLSIPPSVALLIGMWTVHLERFVSRTS